MKIISFIKPTLAFVSATVLLGTMGCKKLASTYLDTGVAVDQVILEYKTGTNPTTGGSVSPTAYGTGLGGFSAANVIVTGSSPDTLRYIIVAAYSSTAVVAPKDVAVTIGLDDSKRTTYNTANSTSYNAFASNMYRIVKTALTIKAGTIYDTTAIEVYSKNVDLSKSWMLPVAITSASGVQLSGNQNTVYFHIIGNPLAGTYKVTGTRYNYSGAVNWNNVLPVPAGYTATTDMSLSSPRSALPDNTTTIEIPFGNVGSGYNYIITYNGGNSITVDYTFDALYSNIVIALATYNASTKTFHIITHYNNALAGAGNDRIFDETLVQQ